MRNENGAQPVRSRKIQGKFYELVAVSRGYGEQLKLREEHPEYFLKDYVTKSATSAEIAKWPELASFRDQSPIDRIMKPAVCLWVKSNKYQ